MEKIIIRIMELSDINDGTVYFQGAEKYMYQLLDTWIEEIEYEQDKANLLMLDYKEDKKALKIVLDYFKVYKTELFEINCEEDRL